jgi:hypothetical protein
LWFCGGCRSTCSLSLSLLLLSLSLSLSLSLLSLSLSQPLHILSLSQAEFVVAGPALTEAKDCGELAQCGEAIISQSVRDLCAACRPQTEEVSSALVASVDGLAADTFFVLKALDAPPVLPTQLLRADTYTALRQCDTPPPPPSRTNWTRLVPPPVLTGHVSSLSHRCDNSNGQVEESMRRFVPHSISACIDSGQSPKEAEECRRVTIMFIRLLDYECEPFDYSLVETPEVRRPPATRPRGLLAWGLVGVKRVLMKRVFISQIIQLCILEIYSLLHRSVPPYSCDDSMSTFTNTPSELTGM